MKFFKIIFVVLIVAPLLFVLFNKSDEPNLDGDWTAKQIILNQKQIYPTEIDNSFGTYYQVNINGMSDSIFMYRDKISAKLVRKTDSNNNQYVMLSSKESSLNGKFSLDIDTIHTGERSYKVNLKLQSNKTLIHLQRIINIGPWKPEFPRKGQV